MGTTTERKSRPRMVDWFSPSQLAQTGLESLLSTVLGSMIDTRRLIAWEGELADCVIDYSQRKGFTFDYMADTGDGWNSTYSMAYLLTRPHITVAGRELRRADVAILGGDEVYPTASAKMYARRLSSPFSQAADDIRAEPQWNRLSRSDIYLVPGNHDWYDSLGSFSRKYLAYRACDGIRTRRLGQFDIRQVRSYFILKLPQDWEIWSLDIQLGHDIDNQQFIFFRDQAQSLKPENKIILCSAEPTIVSGEAKEATALDFNLNRITRLAYDKGAKVLLQLAGDVHNYQRYEIEDRTRARDDTGAPAVVAYKRVQIVSGGGGAFLHPNHGFNKGSLEKPRYEALKRYPDRKTSKRLTRQNWLFAFKHRSMAALIGALYVCFFWSTGVPGPPYGSYPIEHPGSTLLLLVTLLGFMAFAGFDSPKKVVIGFLHGAGHLAVSLLSWRLAEWAVASLLQAGNAELAAYLTRLATFLSGAMLGGTLFGVYLWFSLNFLRLHHNEAFSALGSPHYKNLLRCSVQPDGGLDIQVIGVEKTASEEGQHPVAAHFVEKLTILPSGGAVVVK